MAISTGCGPFPGILIVQQRPLHHRKERPWAWAGFGGPGAPRPRPCEPITSLERSRLGEHTIPHAATAFTTAPTRARPEARASSKTLSVEHHLTSHVAPETPRAAGAACQESQAPRPPPHGSARRSSTSRDSSARRARRARGDASHPATRARPQRWTTSVVDDARSVDASANVSRVGDGRSSGRRGTRARRKAERLRIVRSRPTPHDARGRASTARSRQARARRDAVEIG